MPNTTHTPAAEHRSASCCDWKSLEDLGTRAQTFARQEPAQAVGVAFVAGLIFTVLPVGRLLGALVRLTFVLLRPVLLILGAMKFYEEIDKRNNP